MIFGRAVGLVDGLASSAAIVGLAVFKEPVQGSGITLERFLLQPKQCGVLGGDALRFALLIERDRGLQRRLDGSRKIANALLPTTRIA